MKLADIPAGELVFIDANIFVFYFRPDPVLGPACDQFVHRIETGDIQGFTSSHVLTEMAHRLMTAEAVQRFGWSMTGIARRLKSHPTQACSLVRHRQAIDELSLLGIQVLAVSPAQVSLAADVVCQNGLLISDSLIISIMQDRGLKLLASHDSDFDRVPGIVRYAPV